LRPATRRDGLPEIPICVSYKVNGKKTSEIPAQATMYDKIECLYEKMPGWKGATAGVVEYDKLPAKAKEYLAFVEKESGAKIAMISTGPGREETMYMPEFAAEMKRIRTPISHDGHDGSTKARK
jgi:adenylosuccinate synthase